MPGYFAPDQPPKFATTNPENRMTKLYITDPSCNIDGKPYKTLEAAQEAARIKIDSFVTKVNIYECRLICAMKRGDVSIENFSEPQFEVDQPKQ